MKDRQKIAIVGGGIAGMFCAFVLGSKGRDVWLFESSNRWGGRIRTVRLGKDGVPLKKQSEWNKNNLEFFAEFGPMRLELDKQMLLKALLDRLDIKERSSSGKDAPTQPPDQDTAEPQASNLGDSKPYLIDFPAYSSPESRHDPEYDLRPEEAGKSPLELLRLAFLRILIRLEGLNDETKKKQEKLIMSVTLSAATQDSVDRAFTEWLTQLQPDDYWDVQAHGEIENVPLYTMGFWNLLSDYLSHDAINKIRDFGTFYHLLPENPNAAEWLVWWLVGLGSRERLRGIFGGMQSIIERLEECINDLPVKRELKAKVIGIKKDNGQFTLEFHEREFTEKLPKFDRVILALPKAPLKTIYHNTPEAFSAEREMDSLLDSAFGFPMVKLFFVVSNRWWQGETRANRYATRAPTRELHYWKGATEGSHEGLIMGYSDRPASSFWANYVPPGDQQDVRMETRPAGRDAWKKESSSDVALPTTTRQRLLKKIVQITTANNVPGFAAEDIGWYGIRDWGRGPYHGANHAWRPERKYWVVMRRLGEIGKSNAGGKIHVCGEAYSDYHGFMEGSLRSAVYALHRILDVTPSRRLGVLTWLSGSEAPQLEVEISYLNGLKKWVLSLDKYSTKDSFF